MLTNYTSRCPSIRELLQKAAESIFLMYRNRLATGCYGDSGASSCLIHALLWSKALKLFFLLVKIFFHWRIPGVVGGGPQGEASADNLDITQASFELPWQIHSSLNPIAAPSPYDAISICSREFIGLPASSLICWRSCLQWSSLFPLPSTSFVTHRNVVI